MAKASPALGSARSSSGQCCANEVDDECRGLLDAARRLNEMNRQIRNLIAANVSARLDALTGAPALYRAPGYAYAATRA